MPDRDLRNAGHSLLERRQIGQCEIVAGIDANPHILGSTAGDRQRCQLPFGLSRVIEASPLRTGK